MTNTQIDKLGERLKRGDPSEADVRMLDEYRLSFGEACGHVVTVIRKQLGLELQDLSVRSGKSTSSVCSKLRRERSIRLSQIQDIAGCRVTVSNVVAQAQTVEGLSRALAVAALDDRRHNPSHGYRAIHVIVRQYDKLVEVQVRTDLQHLWAQLSEKLSDKFDPSIKYGAGPEEVRSSLMRVSGFIANLEDAEEHAVLMSQRHADSAVSDGVLSIGAEFLATIESRKHLLRELLEDEIRRISELKGEPGAVSD